MDLRVESRQLDLSQRSTSRARALGEGGIHEHEGVRRRAERARAEAGVDGVTLDEALDRLADDLAGSDEPESLAGRAVDDPALRAQLTRRYSAYVLSAPPG